MELNPLALIVFLSLYIPYYLYSVSLEIKVALLEKQRLAAKWSIYEWIIRFIVYFVKNLVLFPLTTIYARRELKKLRPAKNP